jgi:hypothetical protein
MGVCSRAMAGLCGCVVRGCVVVWLSGGRGRAWPIEGGQRQGRASRTTRTTRTEAAARARQAAGRDDIRRAGRVGDGLYVCGCVVGQIRGHGDGDGEELGRVALAGRVVHAYGQTRVFEGAAGRARIKRTPRAQACEGCDVQEAGRSVPLRQDARRQTPDARRRQDASRKSQSQCTHAASCTSAQASRARPPGKRLETAVMWGVASGLG